MGIQTVRPCQQPIRIAFVNRSEPCLNTVELSLNTVELCLNTVELSLKCVGIDVYSGKLVRNDVYCGELW